MKDAAKVVTEITFYFSVLQNISLLFSIMFVSWLIPIACLQNFRARFRKMYTEWLLLSAEWRILSYILLHFMHLSTRMRLQSADHIKHEIQISHVFGIFPYFSEIFRNFLGNFPEIFRNIIFRKIYITIYHCMPPFFTDRIGIRHIQNSIPLTTSHTASNEVLEER